MAGSGARGRPRVTDTCCSTEATRRVRVSEDSWPWPLSPGSGTPCPFCGEMSAAVRLEHWTPAAPKRCGIVRVFSETEGSTKPRRRLPTTSEVPVTARPHSDQQSRAPGLMPVIPATREAGVRRMAVRGQAGQTVCKNLSLPRPRESWDHRREPPCPACFNGVSRFASDFDPPSRPLE
jgi:hypothetical protein